MKGGFWAGVASAVIAGLVLFFAQQQYSEWKAANSRSIVIRINNDVAALKANDVLNIAEALKEFKQVRIASFIAKNDGSKPIIGATVHFSTEIDMESRIYAYGVVPEHGADPDTVVIQPKSSGFDVTFKSLDRKKTQTFWVAYRCCEIFSASPRTEALSLTQSVSDYDDLDTDWDWFIWASIFIVAFVVGAIVDATVTSNMMKNRGVDLSEILKRPVAKDDKGD